MLGYIAGAFILGVAVGGLFVVKVTEKQVESCMKETEHWFQAFQEKRKRLKDLEESLNKK